MSKDVFLSYSGGLDSAYVLYLLLKCGKNVTLHHVHLIDKRGRHEKEAEAISGTLAWLNRQGLPGTYTYTESTLDVSQHRVWVRDHYNWAFFTGCMLYLNQYKHIDTIASGGHLNSFNDKSSASLRHIEEVDMLYKRFLPLLANRDITIISPIGNMTKLDIIRACPPELRALTWSCRKPVGNKVCHKCHTCKQIDKADKGEASKPLNPDQWLTEKLASNPF